MRISLLLSPYPPPTRALLPRPSHPTPANLLRRPPALHGGQAPQGLDRGAQGELEPGAAERQHGSKQVAGGGAVSGGWVGVDGFVLRPHAPGLRAVPAVGHASCAHRDAGHPQVSDVHLKGSEVEVKLCCLLKLLRRLQHKLLDNFFSICYHVLSPFPSTPDSSLSSSGGHNKQARRMTLLMALCDYLGNSVKDMISAPRPCSTPVRTVTTMRESWGSIWRLDPNHRLQLPFSSVCAATPARCWGRVTSSPSTGSQTTRYWSNRWQSTWLTANLRLFL